ncbi:MAG: efflux RND transporter periplasmic adaptor subunit [Proteobacteria bacterium]|nr:efflux RND transporter periplasmic adaptor subunit [Pseudomonadota bacterium]
MHPRAFPIHLSLLAVAAALAAPGWAAPSAPLPTAPVRVLAGAATTAHEGVVEAERAAAIAPQVPGAVLALPVRPGERVAAGAVLARIDARAAEQGAAAQAAQVAAAQAQVGVAAAELRRREQLATLNYLSRAALEQAQAQHTAAEAALRAARAQAGAARTQSDLGVLRAPFAGVVASVPATVGDMALPGQPLLTLYDPAVLRVTAAVPATALPKAFHAAELRLHVGEQTFTPTRVELLPTVDARSLTQTVRATLPAGTGLVPGQFARLALPGAAAATPALAVPAAAIVRRGELTAVYVQPATGTPLLRQVRLGRAMGQEVEVLAGVAAGEQVVTQPARVR